MTRRHASRVRVDSVWPSAVYSFHVVDDINVV